MLIASELIQKIFVGWFLLLIVGCGCNKRSEGSQARTVEDHQSTLVFATRGSNGTVTLRYVVSCANGRPKEYIDGEYVRAIETNTICEDVTIPRGSGEGFLGNFEDGVYGIGTIDLIDKRFKLNANRKAGKIVSIEVWRWGLSTDLVTTLTEHATYACSSDAKCKSGDGLRSIEVFDNRLVWSEDNRENPLVPRDPIALPNGTFRSQQIPALLSISSATPESVVVNYRPQGIDFVNETWRCEAAVGICSIRKAGKLWSLHLYDSSKQSRAITLGRQIAFARDGAVLVWHAVP
jgi:hypothetical protein